MLFQITDISFDLEESCPYCGGDCIEFPITSCDDFAANATEVISEKRDIAIKSLTTADKIRPNFDIFATNFHLKLSINRATIFK